MGDMKESTEHREEMGRPELFRLELSCGHPSQRPFSALLAALGAMEKEVVQVVPSLQAIRQGQPLQVDDVSQLLVQLGALGAAAGHMLNCLGPLHAAISDALIPTK